MKTIFKTATLALALFISGNVQAQSAAEQESPGPGEAEFQTHLAEAQDAEVAASARLEIIENEIEHLRSQILNAQMSGGTNSNLPALRSRLESLRSEHGIAERNYWRARSEVRQLRTEERLRNQLARIMQFRLPRGEEQPMLESVIPNLESSRLTLEGFGISPESRGMGSSPSVLFGFDGSLDKYLRSDRSMQSIVKEFESGAGSNSVIGE